MKSRRLAVESFVVAWGLVACEGGGSGPIEIPSLDTSGMEAGVVAAIHGAGNRVRAAPDSVESWGLLGMRFQAHDFHAEGVACYRRAAELDPDDYRWPYLAAICAGKADPQSAIPWFERAAALEPDNPAVYVRYGDALAEIGNAGVAREQYRRALALDSQRVSALHGLGLLDLRANDLEGAVAHLEQARELAPHHGPVHNLLAQVYQRQGDAEKAELAALSARAYPDEPGSVDPVLAAVEAQAAGSRARGSRGLILARQGKYAEAETAFRHVMQLREPNARDLANLGGALAGQGKLDEALEQYRRSLALDPAEAYAHNNLALVLMQQGKSEEAREHFLAALAVNPLYADASFNFGLLLENEGRRDDAAERYREALASDPTHRGSLNNLAKLEALQGNEDEAVALWQRGVRIDPLNLDAAYNLSLLHLRRHQHAEAIRHLRGAMRFAPDSSLLSQALAWELATAPVADLRNGAEALQLATRVHGQFPERPETGDILAAALAETGQFDRAAELAGQASERAMAAGRPDLAQQIRERQFLYRKRIPFHQPELPPLP